MASCIYLQTTCKQEKWLGDFQWWPPYEGLVEGFCDILHVTCKQEKWFGDFQQWSPYEGLVEEFCDVLAVIGSSSLSPIASDFHESRCCVCVCGLCLFMCVCVFGLCFVCIFAWKVCGNTFSCWKDLRYIRAAHYYLKPFTYLTDNLWVVQEEKYAHLDKAEVEKVQKCYDDKMAWWGPKMEAQSRIQPFEDPVLLVSQVMAEKKVRPAWLWLTVPCYCYHATRFPAGSGHSAIARVVSCWVVSRRVLARTEKSRVDGLGGWWWW